MIFWSGAGALVPILIILSAIIFSGSSDTSNELVVPFIVAGLLLVPLGIFYRRRVIRLIEENQGEVPKNGMLMQAVINTFGNWKYHKPTFFFIPMHFWGILSIILGIAFYFDF